MSTIGDEAGERAERLAEIRGNFGPGVSPQEWVERAAFLLAELDRVTEKVQRYEYMTCAIHRHPVCSDCTAQSARERDTALADLKRAEAEREKLQAAWEEHSKPSGAPLVKLSTNFAARVQVANMQALWISERLDEYGRRFIEKLYEMTRPIR